MESALDSDYRPPRILAPSPYESVLEVAGRGALSCRSCLLCLAVFALLSGAPSLALGLAHQPWPSTLAAIGVALLAIAFLSLLAGCAPRPARPRKTSLELLVERERGRE